MMIFIGSDHAGFKLKEDIKNFLLSKNLKFADLGVYSENRVDYPDIAEKVAREVLKGKDNIGILICGTGIGICIAANKIKGIRAALLYNEQVAELAKKHNDANIICFGGRTMDINIVAKMIDAFLNSNFEGDRHKTRIEKINKLENL
ncbi:MAG: ribose 5-phosphate isomerase B [Spirochaetes bacterium]|nr:ribose 5-phosphate isomerase B [Spirochaetota bacterium]